MKRENDERVDERPDEEEGGGAEEGRAKGRRAKESAPGHAGRGATILLYMSLLLGVAGLALAGGAWFMVRASQERLVAASTRLTELTQRMAVMAEGFSKYQALMKQQKTLEDETNKKLDERDALVIRAVTQVQARLKLTPTLAKALEAASQPSSAAPPAPPAAPPKAPAADTAKDKIHSQVQGIREAIRKFNAN